MFQIVERIELNKLLVSALTFMLCFFASQKCSAVETCKPKVLEFYASWAEPCKRIQPMIDNARSQYGEGIEFVSVDVDDPENKRLIEQYGVCPIPTLIFVTANNEVSGYSVGTEEGSISRGIKKLLPRTASLPQQSLPLN